MDHDTGVFTGKIIRLISDIRAKHGQDSVKLENCGKFTLAEDLSDISDMTSIDLSRINSLEGRCCLEERSFPTLRTSTQFLKKFFSQNLARNFSSGSQNLQKIPGFFFALFPHTCPACVLIQFHTGDIQVLGNCTQLMSVDFRHCSKITGGCSFEERSFSRLRPSPHLVAQIFPWGILRIVSRVADICTTNKRK